MLRSLLGIGLIFWTAAYGAENNKTRSKEGVGISLISEGMGPYYRRYSDEGYWQIAMIALYTSGSDAPFDARRLYAGTFLTYGHYFHEDLARPELYMPFALKYTLSLGGGIIGGEPGYGVMATVGVEYWHPRREGLFYGFNVGYAVGSSPQQSLMPSLSWSLGLMSGYNF